VGVEASDGEAAGPLPAESQERVQSSAGHAARGAESAAPLHPGTDAPSLVNLLRMALSEEGWEAFSRGSAIRRAGRAGFARNVCVAMGNWLSGSDEPSEEAVSELGQALSDPEPLVRGHAVWALGRVSSPSARQALARASASEDDPFVLEELLRISRR